MLNAIVSDLVEKRLWPVAAILVVLAVGVPMTLSKPSAAPPSPEMPVVAKTVDEGPQLALSRTATTGFARAPRVNTKALDPFGDRSGGASDAIVKKAQDAINSAINAAAGSGGGAAVTVTPPTSSEVPGPTPKAPSTSTPKDDEKTKTETDDVLSVLITVGAAEPEQLDDVRTLSPLPDAENPFLVYVGKTSSGGASFLVSADVTPTGDGTCDPSPQDCRTLTMNAGDTESFKLVDGSIVEVTMIGVDTKKVKVTGTAARAARLEAKGRQVGLAALKSVREDKQVLLSLGRHKVKYRF